LTSVNEIAPTGRAHFLSCAVDAVDMEQALRRCEEYIARGGTAQHMAINAAKLVAMQRDEQLRKAVNDCDLITADGQAVVWASRILGDPLPTRVAGIDLMQELFVLSARKGYRPYILGARAEVLEQAVETLKRQHPGLELAGCRDGYFGPEEEQDVVDGIRRSNADILFVAISSPRKEYFLEEYREALGVPFVMGVGGAIDVVAGRVRRAPRWMQVAGLEWLFRLLQEPKRMFQRYATTNAQFMALVARERLRRRRDAESG
jgi:N-acetylglucosaminyldiphosphoundecaprenol N-acetyl-beta-D-mannosaminyltransferase